MNIYQFMNDSPWLTFFLALGAAEVVTTLFFKLPNRVMRYWTIRRHGYPPAHCDVDGEFRKEKPE